MGKVGELLFNKQGVIRTDHYGLLLAKRAWRKVEQMAGTELTTVNDMLRLMNNEANVATESATEIRDQIANTILAAEDIDDIFSGKHGDLQSGRDLVGVLLDLEEVRWNRSDYEDNEASFPFYAVIKGVRRDTGEQINFAVGAGTAMAQLFRADQLHGFPIEGVTIREGKTSKSGNTPYSFVKVETWTEKDSGNGAKKSRRVKSNVVKDSAGD